MTNGIPLRPGLAPTYAQRLGLLAQPGATVGDILGTGIQPGLPPRARATAGVPGVPVTGRGTPSYLGLMQRPAPMPSMPLAAGAMRQAQDGRFLAPSAPAAAQPGFFERIAGIDPTSAAGQALGAAAATGLQLSGYRPTPITTAEGLGAMMAAGQEAYTSARKQEQEAELARQQRETDLRLKLMEIGATRGKEAKKEGLDIARLRRDLRKDFNDSSKYFNEAKQFWTDVVNYSKPEQSSAADLALVFSYMKMLDPESVVREGEQLQVRGLGGLGAEARALLSRIGIAQEGTYEGGLLIIDPKVREDIRQAAAARFADLVKGQAELEQFTADEGSRAGLTPDFFKSSLTGNGTLKRPYIVKDLSELPDTAKDGDYAIVDGIFQEIKEVS